MMSDLHQIIPLLRSNQVVYAALFGSRAQNRARSDSDYDILIEFSPKKKYTLLDLSSLQRSLKAALGADVDLVTKKSLHPYIKHEVLGTAVPFYEER
ncbi:MAG: DNA polymerase beta [Chloroflexi bacterium]|nr:DNA polymerase beta [Chloroflexota bacterium]MDL1883162.1 nucleotidyltransferase family protein [Anaerolineae bacterium CFX8]